MKKYLFLTASVLVFSAVVILPAYAEHHEGKEAKGIFAKHDANNDGVVTKDEFMSHAETKFKEIDKNSDGKINKEESETHRAEWKEKHKEKREDIKEKMKEKIKDKVDESRENPAADSQ